MYAFRSNIDERTTAYDADRNNGDPSTPSDESRRSIAQENADESTPPPIQNSPKKSLKATSLNLNINASSMTTRYRFRDLFLGDFSLNDDGER